jgi:hypothetical protein
MSVTVSSKISEVDFESGKNIFYYEISSEENLNFDYLIIKNYYVASISISILIEEEKWKIVLDNYTLMHNPNMDEDSERYFIFTKKEMKLLDNNIPKFNKMRIYIYQNSSYWKEYKLNMIKLASDKDLSKEIKEDKIHFDLTPKQQFVFKDINLILLNGKDEINQKYIEISNGKGVSDFNYID